MATQYDIAIVGGGPAGYAAALTGAGSGAKVALIEQRRVGGVCLHRGCIPTKQLLETAAVWRTVAGASAFGVTLPPDLAPGIDWQAALDRKSATVETLFKGLTALLKKKGVESINGVGRLAGSGKVEVLADNRVAQVVEAKSVIVATGSRPKSIPGFEIDGERVVTSNEALTLPSIPARIAIVGAGAIGVEFASMFASLGSDVTLLEALPTVLPGADVEVAAYLGRVLKRRGISIHVGVRELAHTPAGSSPTASFLSFEGESGDSTEIEVDRILVAVGRRPATEELASGPSELDVDSRGYIEVDLADLSTSMPGTYAAGDVIDTPALAHVAFAEGQLAVRSALGLSSKPIDYARVPWCIYSSPEVSFAGMSEDAARSKFGDDLRIGKHRFGGLGRALILGEPEGMIKVLAVDGGPIVGVHIVGAWASELLSPGYLALNLELSPEQIAMFVQPHPSLSEAFGEAVQALAGRPLHA